MKHMKHLLMIAGVLAVAAAGYMAYQRYYGSQEAQIQFLNFGGNYEDGDDFHNRDSSYKAGYRDGKKDCHRS